VVVLTSLRAKPADTTFSSPVNGASSTPDACSAASGSPPPRGSDGNDLAGTSTASAESALDDLFVNWMPAERLRGTAMLRLPGAANQLLGQSQPRKADYRKGQLSLSS
jgi:hypothetical protein